MTDLDCENWSEGDKRELRLILVADELAKIAYGAVDCARCGPPGEGDCGIGRDRRVQRYK